MSNRKPVLIPVTLPSGDPGELVIHQCTERWTRLERTADPSVRHCLRCATDVHRVQNTQDRRMFELHSAGPCCVSIIDMELMGNMQEAPTPKRQKPA